MSHRVVLGVTARPALSVVVDHVDHLREAGWDVHVVVGEPVDPRALPGVTTHHIPMRRGPAPIADLKAWRTWHALLKKLRPDLVVGATPKAALLALTAARAARVPHRLWWVWGLHSDATPVAAKVRLAERITGTAATTVVAASASLANSITRHGYHHDPLVLGAGAINGVDLEVFQRWSSPGPRGPRVTYVGRLSAAKGMCDLVDIWGKVVVDHPSAQLVLAGEPDPLDPAEHAIDALQSIGGVQVLGWVDDVPALLSDSDILVLPSHREGFPAVILEAAACRTPAVAWDVVGSRDAVVNQHTGVLVSLGDTDEFARSVGELLTHRSVRTALGDAAYDRVALHFQRGQVIQRFVELATSFVDSPVSPRGIDESRVAPQVSLEQTPRFAGQPV